MCRRCIVHKGRAVGKSTELGASFLEVQGRIIAKVSSLKACESVKGPVHELKEHKDLEKMKNAIAAGLQIPKEYLEPTLTGHASSLLEADRQLAEDAKRKRAFLSEELYKLLGWVAKREVVASSTVRNHRNEKGEVVRTDYFNEEGELVMIEEVLDLDFEALREVLVKKP